MTDFTLPELATDAAPEFTDPPTCKAWLANVPLANVAEAQRQLLEQLTGFNRFASKAANRLAVLEAIRESVNFVQIEQAKRFTSRAQPMVDAETAVFDDTIALWEQMRVGYLRCLESAAGGEFGMRSHAAQICQRALAYSGLKMFHHYRAYRQVEAVEWRELNRVYAIADELGVAEQKVTDYLNRDIHDTSPRIAYMRATLLGMANPNELAQRQLTFLAFLLERWAEKVEVEKKPVDEGDAPPLVADLDSDRCAERGGPVARNPRYLVAKRLSRSLRNRIALLRKGESPAKLALGEDCAQPACEQLMVFLYRQWCQPRIARSADRRLVADVAQACNDMAAIHYYISGHVFRQPGENRDLSSKERNEIATFGRVSTRDEDDYSVVHGFLLEHWQLEDESMQGLKMVRRAGNAGRRYSHGQLVGVRPADSRNYMLGQVRWLMSAGNGDLFMGLKLLPGLPAATAVRPTGINVAREKYVQALSLTAVPALKSPPTLVLPPGWFKPRRVIEVFLQAPIRIQLNELVERGSDFERVLYEAAG
jgi:hypothetical protein